MIILGDEGHYHGRFPWVTASLIGINIFVFAVQVSLGEPFTNGFSLVPGEVTSFQDFKGTKYHTAKIEVPGHFDRRGQYQPPRTETKQFPIKHYTGPFPIFLTLLTSMFMHGDIFHLLGNMWFLLVFGRNVECAMDHGRFLAFYIACGVCAGLAHIGSEPSSVIPCLGASGAISGVLGAYVSIHPLNNIKVWFGWLFGVIEVPALVVIGFWFLVQYVSACMTLEHGESDGIAYWAHLGGFTAGFIILRGITFYLHQQVASGELTEPEPLLGTEDMPARPSLPEPPLPPPVETGVKSGAPDPFATFLSMETLHRVREQSKKEQPSGS